MREPVRDRGERSDEDLATRAMAGDASAWDALARRHGRRVVLTLLARGLPLDRAEDLAQEVWMRLVQQQRAGRLREIRMPGLALAQAEWLGREAQRTVARRHAIAPHVALDALGEALPVAESQVPDPVEQAAVREQMATIEAELDRCSARAREVFHAVYDGPGRSHAEVAAALGLSVQRVRQTVCEVRARLRRALVSREGEESP